MLRTTRPGARCGRGKGSCQRGRARFVGFSGDLYKCLSDIRHTAIHTPDGHAISARMTWNELFAIAAEYDIDLSSIIETTQSPPKEDD